MTQFGYTAICEQKQREEGRQSAARSRTIAHLPKEAHHLDKADPFPVDRAIGEADPAGHAGLALPGGVANPDQLRMVPAARGVRPPAVPGGQAGRRHLPRLVDPSRGGPRPRPGPDLLAEPADRHPQRGRDLGVRAGSAESAGRRPGHVGWKLPSTDCPHGWAPGTV
jgi:hypothetical protein